MRVKEEAVETLGLCGCGDVAGTYNFLRDVLKAIGKPGEKRSPFAPNSYERVRALVVANPDMATESLFNLLDNLDLLSHGGTTTGSWLHENAYPIVDGPAAMDGDFDE